MQGIALQSGWETFLLAAPIVGMVLVGVFHLDEIAADGNRGQGCGLPDDGSARAARIDNPDGRPWNDSAANGAHSSN